MSAAAARVRKGLIALGCCKSRQGSGMLVNVSTNNDPAVEVAREQAPHACSADGLMP